MRAGSSPGAGRSVRALQVVELVAGKVREDFELVAGGVARRRSIVVHGGVMRVHCIQGNTRSYTHMDGGKISLGWREIYIFCRNKL